MKDSEENRSAYRTQADSIVHAIEHDTGHVLTEWERGLVETTVKYLTPEEEPVKEPDRLIYVGGARCPFCRRAEHSGLCL